MQTLDQVKIGCAFKDIGCRRQSLSINRGLRVRASSGNGSNGAGGHHVPPAWPGRAVIDPNFKPRTDAKVTYITIQIYWRSSSCHLEVIFAYAIHISKSQDQDRNKIREHCVPLDFSNCRGTLIRPRSIPFGAWFWAVIDPKFEPSQDIDIDVQDMRSSRLLVFKLSNTSTWTHHWRSQSAKDAKIHDSLLKVFGYWSW